MVGVKARRVNAAVDDIVLVVQKGDLYLDGSDKWGPYADAWKYATPAAFADADDMGGSVVMVMPGGRQLPVSLDDFNVE